MPPAGDPALSMRHSLPLLLALLAASASAQSSAAIEQVGSQNLAVLTQGVSAGGPGDARIVQAGAGRHVARLDQRGGTATVEQDGEGHLLAGFSGGLPDPSASALSLDRSELVLRQAGGVGNQAFVEQFGGAFAEILQLGSDNLVSLRQSGGGVVQITQTGADNAARITQTGF